MLLLVKHIGLGYRLRLRLLANIGLGYWSNTRGVCSDDGCSISSLPQVARMVKFLNAISVCDHVVSPDWLESSIEESLWVS